MIMNGICLLAGVPNIHIQSGYIKLVIDIIGISDKIQIDTFTKR